MRRLAAFAAALVFAATLCAADDAKLDLAEIDRLSVEGSKFFDVSGDTDLPREKRDEARRQSYSLLKKAMTTLDRWCDAHPDDVERLDDRMVELHRKLFWLKKESAVPLGDEPTTPAAPPANAPPPPGPSPGMPPSPPIPAPGQPPTPPSSHPPTPTPPAPVGPPPGATPARDAFDEAGAYEKAHPSDEPGMLERWIEALASSPDSSSEKSRAALARVAKLSETLKQYYRKVRNDDPDSLDPEKDPGRAAQVAAKLASGLDASDPGERRAAAGRLADLGYTPAGSSIYEALRREKTADVRKDLFLALVRLGGRRTCEYLARFAKEKSADLQGDAVRSLAAIAQKDAVQARFAVLAAAEFVVEARVSDAARAAVASLKGLGALGVPGLVKGLATKDASVEIEAIDALGALKDARAAPSLCDRLDSDAAQSPRSTAAQAALAAIARPAIPALIESLKKKKSKRLAGVLLYDLSGGQTFGEDARAWSDWWKTQK